MKHWILGLGLCVGLMSANNARAQDVPMPFWPAVHSGPWVSYSPGPVYFTSNYGVPLMVGEIRFTYNQFAYLPPQAYWQSGTYWPFWGFWPYWGQPYPMGRTTYYYVPAYVKADAPKRDELVKSGNASTLYGKGYTAYWEGKLDVAYEYLAAAITLDRNDPRAWAYLSLTHRGLGDTKAASAAARAHVAARVLSPSSEKATRSALERVQGESRESLTSIDVDETNARSILAELPGLNRSATLAGR